METTSNAEETSPETPTSVPEETSVDLPPQEPLADGAAEIAPEVAAEAASEPTGEDFVAEPAPAENGEETAFSDDQPASPEDAAQDPAPLDELDQLVAQAQKGRLSASDEDRTKALLREGLLAGKAGVARAAALLPRFVWVIGVDAVTAAWPEMKVTSRAQLLKALSDEESDSVRRMRLSLARGLFKTDVTAALKVATGVTRELRDKETGAISPKHAQIFSNVFIGKAKPWVANLPLAELKPADADTLVHCAVVSTFWLPHPPITQLGVLKWVGESGRLDKLHETALTAVIKSVSRWSAKWQNALRNEVSELPVAIAVVLKPAVAEAPARLEAPELGLEPPAELEAEPTALSEDVVRDLDQDDEDADEAIERESVEEAPIRKERPVYEPRPQKPAAESRGEDPRDRDRGKDRDRERDPRDARKERPVYQARNGGAGSAGFNLGDTLRQIDAHVQSLRADLASAQSKLRERDDDRGRSPRRALPERPTPIVHGEPTLEELARLNQQLEARIGELQARVTELTSDSEDRAVSTGVMTGEPPSDPDSQLRTLLGLKLQEDYADFVALETEAPDLVVQQHYKALLKDVFAVLRQEGVPFKDAVEG